MANRRWYVWLHGEPVDPRRVHVRRGVLEPGGEFVTSVTIDDIEVTDCTVEADHDGKLYLIASV